MTFMMRVSNSLARTVKAALARGIHAHQEYLWTSACLSSAQMFGQVRHPLSSAAEPPGYVTLACLLLACLHHPHPSRPSRVCVPFASSDSEDRWDLADL